MNNESKSPAQAELTAEERIRRDWPEVTLLETLNGRHEAYITLHGEWCNSREEAIASLDQKLRGRR